MGEIDSTNHSRTQHSLFFSICVLVAAIAGNGGILPRQVWAEEGHLFYGSSPGESNPCSVLWSRGGAIPPEGVNQNKAGAQLQVAGVTGSNPYLRRIQSQIGRFWTAPPVDLSGRAMTVTVAFRLERDGRVNNLKIEKSSGNEYYDIAATRAVQSAVPFPPFPPDMTNPYLDCQYTFGVGEARGGLEPPKKIIVQYSQSSDSDLNFRELHFADGTTTPVAPSYDDCRKHLDKLLNAIHQVPQNEDGLRRLHRLANEIPSVNKEDVGFIQHSELQSYAEDLHNKIRDRTKEITEKVATATRWRQFDALCESKILTSEFPARFRDEPVVSSRPETKTLGRAFCTAVNGGGKVEFQVLDEKTPTVAIFIATTKRRFAVVLQKKMRGDLTEAWRAVEIQTPSDRRPAYEMLGQTFMDGFPELVQNE
ncbi:MAG: TonB C-terminal domain-containing protein [Nitrospira sp.]|nr:TonB C-terminal domain-containing protein [Nitrospira sp.]